MNILINYAMPLLLFLVNIKQKSHETNVNQLRSSLIHKISEFDNTIAKHEVSQCERLAARYCLCTSIDEAIHKTQSNIASEWSHQTLLSLLHNDTWGGERFYTIINVMLQTPSQYLQLIEFCYVLLSLGFEGMYFADNSHHRESLRQKLFQVINNKHPKITRALSQQKPTLNKNHYYHAKQKVYKISLLTCLFCCFMLFSIFNIIGYRYTSNTLTTLSHLAKESPITAYSQLINRPIINYNET